MTNRSEIERIIAPVRVQAEEILRRDILEGRLLSGERIVEKDICERFGVSRPLVRECLRQLQAENLVTHLPNSGLRVATIGLKEACELYDVRILLEPYAAQEFTINASCNQREILGELTENMLEAIKAGDKNSAMKHKNNFYKTLVKGANNAVLESTLTGLQNRILLMRGVSMSVPGRLQETAKEIKKLQESISRNNPEMAWDASHHHLVKARETTIKALTAKKK